MNAIQDELERAERLIELHTPTEEDIDTFLDIMSTIPRPEPVPVRVCLTSACAPKNEPPTCPVHKCTMYFGGYGWICPLCEREMEEQRHEADDIWAEEWQETYESLRNIP